MSNKLNYGTDKFEEKLQKIEHFKKHPQMMPFIGKNWGTHKKLLIVAESHYLQDESENAERWYELSKNELSKNEQGRMDIQWTATHEITDGVIGRLLAGESLERGHTLYRNIAAAMEEADTQKKTAALDHIFSACAYMNYFQRPAAVEGQSIDPDSRDLEVAYSTLCQIAEIIKPGYIFFCTAKGWNAFQEEHQETNTQQRLSESIKRGRSCHAAREWWNKASASYRDYTAGDKKTGKKKKVTGRESFISFIKHHNIFS